MTSKEVGVLGEKIALNYLKNKGYKILDKNYFRKWEGLAYGEIDIIGKPHRNVFDILRGKKNDTIHFIEVKTLRQARDNPFSPEEKVNFQKQRKLIKTAHSWLMEKRIPLDTKWQIDVISIKIDSFSKKARVRHFENAIDTNF